MHDHAEIQGFTEYASRAWPHLRHQAFLLCGDWHEAEDLVQDTLAAVYLRWPKITRHDAVEGYIRTTLVHTFLSARRRTRWKSEILRPEPPDRPRPGDHALDDRLSMLAGLRQLPPRQRTVIMLRFWGDLSVQQTADTMGISPGAVASQNHKALAALRQSLAGLR